MEKEHLHLTKTTAAKLGAILTAILLITVSGVGFAGAVDGGAPGGRPANLAWHDGQLWDSVVLGPLHGNPPSHTLDAFYTFPAAVGQAPVAGAGPGDTDYNGGRWQPFICTGGGSFTDGDQVEAAIAALSIICTPGGGPFAGAKFLCPLTNPNA